MTKLERTDEGARDANQRDTAWLGGGRATNPIPSTPTFATISRRESNPPGDSIRAESAKRRWPWSRLKTSRRLKFTREGKFFVGITLGVGFAAINTGNNLLYLLLGMLLALIIVSGLMSELSLRDLTVIRRLPLRAQVARPHL